MNYHIIKLNEIDSTNNHLEHLLETEEISEGTLVITEYQRHGKGSLYNAWHSEAGKNLLLSFLLKPKELQIENQFYLSKSISLAIHDMLADYLNQDIIHIKWPNDIYVSSKKMSGILIKCNLRNTLIQHAIVGIGININQKTFPKNLRASSIILESGKSNEIDVILENLLNKIDQRMDQFKIGNYSIIDADYHDRLLGYQNWMQFSVDQKIFDGKIIKVGNDGLLFLENKDGIVTKYEAKEISLISTQIA